MITIYSVLDLGELVISTAGRDSGRYFIVVEIVDNKYIKIADGDLRKIEEPKLKNIKHVQSTGYKFENLSTRLAHGHQIRNEKLKNLIKNYLKDKED